MIIRNIFLLPLVCLAYLILSINNSANAISFDPAGLITISFPENGANVGSGIHLKTGLSADTICVQGAIYSMNPIPNGAVPQTMNARIHKVSDASSFFQDTNVSAEAQAKFITSPISMDFKTKYVTSHSFKNSSSMVSVYVDVEQRLYLAPTNITQRDLATTPDTSLSRNVKLTSEALTLLSSDPAQFRKQCGDGFVAVLVSGGELLGTITITDEASTNSNSQNYSAAVSYSGVDVSGSVDSVVKSLSEHHQTSIDFTQSGGSGFSTPTDEASLVQAIKTLPANVAAAPFGLTVIVRDYQSLPNWPVAAIPFSEPSPLEKLMAIYWRVNAAIETAEDVTATQPDRPPAYHYGWNITAGATPDERLSGVRLLHDKLVAKRGILISQIDKCVTEKQCEEPAVSSNDLYSLAVQLPVPFPPKTPGALNFLQSWNAIGNAVSNFNAQKAQWVAYAWQHFGTDGNCYYRNNYVTQAFERNGYPANIARSISDFRLAVQAFPAALQSDAVDYYVRQPVQAICQNSPTDDACRLQEADFQNIASMVVLKGRQETDNFDQGSSDQYGPCPGGLAATRYLSAGLH